MKSKILNIVLKEMSPYLDIDQCNKLSDILNYVFKDIEVVKIDKNSINTNSLDNNVVLDKFLRFLSTGK